jgi:hypothetical protein
VEVVLWVFERYETCKATQGLSASMRYWLVQGGRIGMLGLGKTLMDEDWWNRPVRHPNQTTPSNPSPNATIHHLLTLARTLPLHLEHSQTPEETRFKNCSMTRRLG